MMVARRFGLLVHAQNGPARSLSGDVRACSARGAQAPGGGA